jgi:uncharacterized protein YerC
MPKVKPHEIDKKEKYEIIGNFFEIISNLKSKKEVIDFFVGLLTSSESLMMARRIQIAQMILDDEEYEAIRRALKVSNQTITKTDQWLHGEDDKYNRWLAMQLRKKPKKAEKTGEQFSTLDKYAHHRFLRDLLK